MLVLFELVSAAGGRAAEMSVGEISWTVTMGWSYMSSREAGFGAYDILAKTILAVACRRKLNAGASFRSCGKPDQKTLRESGSLRGLVLV